VRQFREKAQTDVGLINAGFFHLSSRFFEYLDDNDACTLEHEPLEKLAQDGELMVFHHTGFWHPVDTPRDLDTVNMLWDKGEAPW
jgi:glucose-1-phosphate cytidylyltransferase